MTDKRKITPGIVVFGILALWFVAANTVFAFRHPWLTSTERFLLMKQALLFERVER